MFPVPKVNHKPKKNVFLNFLMQCSMPCFLKGRNLAQQLCVTAIKLLTASSQLSKPPSS